MSIWIGTSGWCYQHWKGSFYPERLAESHFLSYYMEHFQTVEINRTFYSLPDRTVFERYAKSCPPSFIFSIKASRFITHTKRLKDPKPALAKMMRRIGKLGKHLGPILFQLPPKWKVNPERLSAFCRSLPKGLRYAFEMRDPSRSIPKYHAFGVA